MQLPILTLTLNPALDMATEVPAMIPGHKLRCTEPHLDPGGGGLNVSRAIKALGGDSLALVALGGLTGDRLAGLIRAEGITYLSTLGPGETRQSLTVTEAASGKQFRFMLPGPNWGAAEQARVFTMLRATSRPGGLSVISGSQPPGVPADFPAQLAESMEGSRVVLDTSGPALFQAVRHPIPGLAVLRMDGEEGEELAGRKRPPPVFPGTKGQGEIDRRRGRQLRCGLRAGAGARAGYGDGPDDGFRRRGCRRHHRRHPALPGGGCDAADAGGDGSGNLIRPRKSSLGLMGRAE